ncbi:MAG TPA: hypothetical protein DCG47_04260 [Spirochaetaceae bacterium]|nr:hypothetical protein [Spirochaetaceae bacterium]
MKVRIALMGIILAAFLHSPAQAQAQSQTRQAPQAVVQLDKLYVSPGAGIDEKAAKAVAAQAMEAFAYRYLPFFPNEAERARGLALSFVFASDPQLLVLTGRSKAGMEESINLYWNEKKELESQLPPLIFSLWARMAGLADRWRGSAPQPSLELSVVASGAMLAADPSMPQSYGAVSAAPGGGLFLAGIGFLAELGPDLGLRTSYRLDPANPYLYLYSMATSHAGTVAGMTSTGDVWTLKRGDAAFQKVAAVQPLPSGFKLAPEGAPVFQDYTTMGFVKLVGRRRAALELKGPKPITMAAFDYDEDGNFWSYDIMSGLVRAYSPAGELIQALRLVQADGEAVVPQRLHLRGSEFLLVSTTSLAAFDRFGLPLWRMDKPSPQSDPLMESMIYGSAIGTDGSLYLLLSGGGLTLTRYDDARSLDAQRRLGDDAFASTLERAIALNAAVRADTDSEAAYAARAKFFQESGLSMSELTLRDAFAAAFPGNRENAKRLGDLKAGLLRAAALSAADAVYDPLARYGAETARADYQKAMRLLERYLGDHPDDTKLAQAMAALGDAFRARESGVAPFKKTPLIIEAKIGPLFPAFMERYRTVPAGYVRIRNAGSESVQGISLSLSIKDFMDYPLELKLPGPLAAGAALELPIALVLNRSVLELREELTVAALVRADSDKAEGSAALSIVFRSRTALTWEDTAALAAFITPNDDAIVSFVHAALFFDPPPLFGRAFSRAFAIVNALGARGLVYVEDPLTPFTLVAAGGSRGSSPLIDTVRFPRSTLGSGAGDCDDTTALLASCLEAAGVRTAILTTPGHVLLAFAADGPPDGPGRYGIDPKRYGAIERDGSWWIPLETTVLSKGFAEAWRQGYAEASARLAALELVPLAVARSAYPALPLAGTPGEAPLAAPAAYSALARSSLAALKDSFVLPQQLAATNARAGKAGAELFNNLGVRLVQLGDYSEAATAFREAARLDPLSSPPRVNLITALSLAGDDKGAAEALALAERDFPGSASIGRLAQRLGTRLVQAPSTVSGTAGTGLAGSASGIEGTRSSGASLIELEW